MQSRVMGQMIQYFGHDVRRINHALKVHAFAMLIGSRESLESRLMEIVSSTALLHDIGIHEAERKYHSTAGNYQQIEGPPIARKILRELGADADIIDRVCFITANHHTYSQIDGIDFQVLVEADFLVNIYEDEVKPEATASIYEKIFRTRAGKDLFQTMYSG